jgi:anaerobic carbon-monoxide dehydrogenase catalytic subunit
MDYVRLLSLGINLVAAGGMGDISDLPLAAFIPDGLSETGPSIGLCLAASGVHTILGGVPDNLTQRAAGYLDDGFEKIYGGRLVFESDPLKIAQIMIGRIDQKRQALGIDKARERVLFDMAMRREVK